MNTPKTRPIPILMYHSISNEASPAFKPYTVAPEMFEKHLAYLSQHDYCALTVTQLAAILAKPVPAAELPPRPIVLTFDDGFEDFYTCAWPALQRFKLPATLYVVAGGVGGTSTWLKREGESRRRMLSWDQLAELCAGGIECGGHSLTHPQLDLLPASRASREIIDCKLMLEEKLGRKIYSFAYPHGYHTRSIQRMVREAGYSSACAVKYAMSATNDDIWGLSRLFVSNQVDEQRLGQLLTGQNNPLIGPVKRWLAPAWRLKRRLASNN
ncbi:MAG: polysaccharide deacetylase family protein [Chloroflexi bacterium]|nr:polysaccharide deacetylase family protein [Chloroflexota bacterium]